MDAIDSISPDPLAANYANLTGATVWVFSIDSVEYEDQVHAAVEHLKHLKIRKILLCGHSEGGILASKIEVALQRDPSFKVCGLILLNPVGLEDRNPWELTLAFLRNGVQAFFKEPKAKTAARDLSRSVIHTVRTGKFASFIKGIQELAKKNPDFAEVRVPIVFQQSDEDITTTDIAVLEELFPNSKWVEMHTPEGDHGSPLYHAEATVRASLSSLSKSSQGKAVDGKDGNSFP